MTSAGSRSVDDVGRRHVVDQSWERFGNTVLSGSPLTVFRTTPAGEQVLDAIERGERVTSSALVDRLLDTGSIHPISECSAIWTVDDVTIVTPQLGGVTSTDGRVVVDDGSEPPLADAQVRLDLNQGPAAARNAARPFVHTEFIAFVDADVDLFVDVGIGSWLDALLPHFDDPAVGLVAPRVTGEVGSPLDLGDQPARIRSGTRVSYIPAAAIVVRTAAFDAIGGFDERLRFGEDVDLVWRLDQAGWRCRYEPASVVWHAPRSTRSARMHQHCGYGSSAAPLALRHPGQLSPVHSNGWTAAVWTALAAGHPLIAGLVAVGTALRLGPKLPALPPVRTFTLAIQGHLRAGGQFAAAIRRVWWPIFVVGGLCSRRVRWAALAAAAASPSTVATDAAYGWGVWRGVIRHRTIAPLVPRWRAWPPRR
jgi:mycofactocin system glycosyltransferase